MAQQDILEINPDSNMVKWADDICGEKRKCGEKSQLLTSNFKFVLFHLERERQLGAARADIHSMLCSSEIILAIRDSLLSNSLPEKQREALFACAKTSVMEHGLLVPPLSALIWTASSKKKSAKCQRTSLGFLILLLTGSPEKAVANTTLFSNEVQPLFILNKAHRDKGSHPARKVQFFFNIVQTGRGGDSFPC